jgi:drug/metabolite transporter (DMT)-like permease
VVNNTMMIQIAVLAIIFLGERLGPPQIAGLACAGLGALIVQLLPALRRRAATRAATRALGGARHASVAGHRTEEPPRQPL